MVKELICIISEEDFRKLNLKGYMSTHDGIKEVNINDKLDREIKAVIADGYEDEASWLTTPVTIAIHEEPCQKDYDEVRDTYKLISESKVLDIVRHRFMYLDKYMNRFGATSFYIGLGISHLYSSRDYYECHDDYWKVRKAETKVIYRVKLSDIWKNSFVVKHKTVKEDWKFNTLPEGVSPNFDDAKLCTEYDRVDDDFVTKGRYGKFRYGRMTMIVAVDENGKRVKEE